MSEYLTELERLTRTCREIAESRKSGDLAPALASLHSAIDSIHGSWSGSFIGHHSLIYLEGFKRRQAGELFDIEWGTIQDRLNRTTGSWREYAVQDINQAIADRTHDGDLARLEQRASSAKEAFSECKQELLAALDVALEFRDSAALRDLRQQAASVESHIPASQILSQLRPPGPFITRDTTALALGIQMPPHLERLAWLKEAESCFDQCAELAGLASRTLSHLKARKSLTFARTKSHREPDDAEHSRLSTQVQRVERIMPLRNYWHLLLGGAVGFLLAILSNIAADLVGGQFAAYLSLPWRITILVLLIVGGLLFAAWIDSRGQLPSQQGIQSVQESAIRQSSEPLAQSFFEQPVQLALQEIHFRPGGWAGSMPALPLTFSLLVDLRNRGDEAIIVKRVDITQFEMGSDLLGAQPMRIRWREADGQTWPDMSWPIRLEKGDWRPRIQCEIEVQLTDRDPSRFAARLDELQSYQLTLQYHFEMFSGTQGQAALPISGSFAPFVAKIKEEWQTRHLDDLIAISEHAPTPPEAALLRVLCAGIAQNPSRDYSHVDASMREQAQLDSPAYARTVRHLLQGAYVEEVLPPEVPRAANLAYPYLRLLPRGRRFCREHTTE